VRNLLSLVGLVVVVFLGLGWYLNWYSFAVQPGTDGKQRIQVDVDTRKITDDAQRARERVGKVLASDPNAATVPTQSANDLMGPPVPPNFQRPGTQPTGKR
jgi:hypothetical protein